jgi:hypothetical protein
VVEVIELDRGAGRRQWIRLTQDGLLVGYCASMVEVARHLDLSDLVPADEPGPRDESGPAGRPGPADQP